MAAATSSVVTLVDVHKVGARQLITKEVTLVLSSQGGLTNNVSATILGFRKIVSAAGFRDSNSVFVGAAPSFDGSKLVFYALETNGNPTDISATVKGLVTGLQD